MRRFLLLISFFCLCGLSVAATASAQEASSPTVDSVTILGTAANPVIILRGADFGSEPATDPSGGTSNFGKCGPIAGNTGEDFGTSLWISDTSQLWSAGNSPLVDCMGLRVIKYTNTTIVYRLGSFYKINYKARNNFSHGIYQLRRGDQAIIYVGGLSVPIRIVYNRPIHVTSVTGQFWNGFVSPDSGFGPHGDVTATKAGGVVGGTLTSGHSTGGDNGDFASSFSGTVTCLRVVGDDVVVGAVGQETTEHTRSSTDPGGVVTPPYGPTVDPRQFVQILSFKINQPPTPVFVSGGSEVESTQLFGLIYSSSFSGAEDGFPSTTPPNCSSPSYPDMSNVYNVAVTP